MSQNMNTSATSFGEVVPPSGNRWWSIGAGLLIAAVLGYGAALIATDNLPGSDQSVAAPETAVAAPQVASQPLRSSAETSPAYRYVSPDLAEAPGSSVAPTAADALSSAEFAELEDVSQHARFWSGVEASPAFRYTPAGTAEALVPQSESSAYRYVSPDLAEAPGSSVAPTAADALSSAEFAELEDVSQHARFWSGVEASPAFRYTPAGTAEALVPQSESSAYRYVSPDLAEAPGSSVAPTAADALSSAEFAELEDVSQHARFWSGVEASPAFRYTPAGTLETSE